MMRWNRSDFGAEGVAVTLALEGGRVGLQYCGVSGGIVAGFHTGRGDCRRCRRRFLYGFGIISQAEVERHGLGYRYRGAGLAGKRISGYVWCGYYRFVQQLEVDVGFSFPAVDDCLRDFTGIKGVQQGPGVDNRASGAVDDYGPALKRVKEGAVGKMMGGMITSLGVGGMECYHVTFACYRREIDKSIARLALGSRGVACHHTVPHRASPLLDNTAYVPYTYHAYREIGRGPVGQECEDRGPYILCNSRRITSRRTYHLDSPALTIVEVDMVGTYRGGSYQRATRTIEQRGIGMGTGACKERVGIFHDLWRDFIGCELHEFDTVT